MSHIGWIEPSRDEPSWGDAMSAAGTPSARAVVVACLAAAAPFIALLVLSALAVEERLSMPTAYLPLGP